MKGVYCFNLAFQIGRNGTIDYGDVAGSFDDGDVQVGATATGSQSRRHARCISPDHD